MLDGTWGTRLRGGRAPFGELGGGCQARLPKGAPLRVSRRPGAARGGARPPHGIRRAMRTHLRPKGCPRRVGAPGPFAYFVMQRGSG